MARKTPERTKRSTYVPRNSRKSEDIISSAIDFNIPPGKKVRKALPASLLRKNNEQSEADEDLIYLKTKNIKEVREQKYNGLLKGWITSSSTASKNSYQDFDADSCHPERISDITSPAKSTKCSSKNAVSARMNRLKKKQYILSLENSYKKLQKQNDELQQNFQKQKETMAALQHGISYLKSLLVNSKELSEILMNLKTSTGLPVTSSLKSAVTEAITNENLHTEIVKTEKISERQAHVRRVTDGSNFPILQHDVNLGDYGLKETPQDEFLCNFDEESHFSFSGESALTLDGIVLSESNIEFNSLMYNYLDDKRFEREAKIGKEVISLKTPELNNIQSDVGLCLHINKRKISVELCSVCNSNAQGQQTEISIESPL